MLSTGITSAAYIAAAVLFILSLGGLSNQESAKRAVWYGIVGMGLAMFATVFGPGVGNYILIALMVCIGSYLGVVVARRVEMTEMPQLVAALHSFVGLAAVFIGLNAEFELANVRQLLASGGDIDTLTGFGKKLAGKDAVEIAILKVEVFLGVFIGAVTFTGSVVAFGKLAGKLSGTPFKLPGGHALNALALLASIALMVLYAGGLGVWTMVAVMVIAGFIGWHLIMGIGGADMPVVVSMLNSYSGWAAAAIGFTLGNDLLIVVGALVGSSGAILSYIMCKAMNRSLGHVLFSGFGTVKEATKVEGEVKPINSEDAFLILEAAQSVTFVPGYGMAVAQAQHVVRELGELLEKNGAEVTYAIHPVAGRMPGHMNVLLAEANVPYDQLVEMEDINPRIDKVDVAVVIGANDVVNPAARNDENSPIYGMPIINVDYAQTVFVLKRSMASGFSGVDNPLFFGDNTRMLFGDAKQSIAAVVAEFKT